MDKKFMGKLHEALKYNKYFEVEKSYYSDNGKIFFMKKGSPFHYLINLCDDFIKFYKKNYAIEFYSLITDVSFYTLKSYKGTLTELADDIIKELGEWI